MIYTIASVLIASAAGYAGYRRGFQKMWIVLFNVLVSIYTAVMAARAICQIIEGAENCQYCKAAIVIVIAAAMYLILKVIAKFLVEDDYIRALPKIFDNAAGAILGFFTGLVCTGFVITGLYMFVSKINSMPEIIKKQIAEKAVSAVIKSCEFTGSISMQSVKSNDQVKDTVNWLTAGTKTDKE